MNEWLDRLESKIVPVDKIVESMKQKHSAQQTAILHKQQHENFEYNLMTQLNDGDGLHAHKAVKEKRTLGNSASSGAKIGSDLTKISDTKIFNRLYL